MPTYAMLVELHWEPFTTDEWDSIGGFFLQLTRAGIEQPPMEIPQGPNRHEFIAHQGEHVKAEIWTVGVDEQVSERATLELRIDEDLSNVPPPPKPRHFGWRPLRRIEI